MKLKNKTVFLTGAAKGIGYLLAQKFHDKGANLLLIDRDGESLEDLREKLKTRCKIYICDLSSEVQLNALIAQISKEVNCIDILINNAGVGVYKPVQDISYDEWMDSYRVNVFAPFLLIQKFLPKLNKSVYPLVVNVGSISGVEAKPERTLYCSTKFALRGLSLSLSKEFENDKTKFVLITLGSTLTEFGPLTLSEKIQKQKGGKNYFSPEFVAQKIISIIENDDYKEEVVLVP